MYFASAFLAETLTDNPLLRDYANTFENINPVFGWFVLPEMTSWALADFENYMIANYKYIEPEDFSTIDGYQFGGSTIFDSKSLAIVVRNYTFLMRAYSAGYYELDEADWNALILGAIYVFAYSDRIITELNFGGVTRIFG